MVKYTGTSHDVTLTVVAPVAGKMHVNGEDVEVVAGENKIRRWFRRLW